jgi:hypothetical protein
MGSNARYDRTMQPVELRTCPFCAHSAPILAAVGRESVERVAVMYPEYGAVGPMATADEPPGHAEHLWNQRFDVDH